MKISQISAACFLVLMALNSQADSSLDNLFPSSDTNSALYYQLGGGNSVPMPAVSDSIPFPVNVDGNVGAGFSCGKFDPTATITNSLNDMGSSVENVSQEVMSHATSAITSFPMYTLAKADPKLYDILNNNIIGAHNQFDLNMKSCQQMQSEALQGQDPYNDWISVSRNDSMKSMMTAGDEGATTDLNQAVANVNQVQGNNGVPWSTPGVPSGSDAGGLGQPPILVVHDTVIAGYNVELNRDPGDTSTPNSDSNNQNLLNYWSTPESAADWVVSVVGDQKVTTCEGPGCDKNSTPGTGLLPYVEKATQDITKKLQGLVQDPALMNDSENLLAVSAPGQMVSRSLVTDIKQMNPDAQATTIATLSQNIATTRIVDEALLAIDLLQTGAEVPAIQAVGPAQTEISQKVQLLQADIDHIMYSVNIRRQLNSNVMSSIVQYNQEQNAKAASVPGVSETPAAMTHGAIVNNPENPS